MSYRALAWTFTAFAAGTLPSPWLVARLARRPDVVAEMHRGSSPGDAHFLVSKRISGTLGVTSVVLDVVKGFVPAIAARASGEPGSTLALVGVAAVAGHCFAPFVRAAGGRGLTTAAGVAFALVPKSMVVAGLVSALGMTAKAGGFGTSLGFGALPALSAAFSYPAPLVLMSGGLVALIAVRRLEGIGDDRRRGVALGRALVSRLLFDLPDGKHSSRSEPA